MKLLFPFILFLSVTLINAQETIRLPHTGNSDISWEGTEKQYFSKIWDTQVVTNVSKPTMQVFRPSKANNTGVAVIVAPGGALYALSIESEGNEVAKWLNSKGITAFVLKYRLVPTSEDGVAEVSKIWENNPQKMYKEVAKVLPSSIQDGLNAISYVRQNATEFDIDSKKIGFMGFSAGGAVTMGVGYNYNASNCPDFLVPVYPWTDVMPVQTPKPDAPPMLVICASDDPLGLAKGSVELYTSMLEAGKKVGLHMYSQGGHGFGMRKNNLPADTWIERFYDWSIAEGITQPKM